MATSVGVLAFVGCIVTTLNAGVAFAEEAKPRGAASSPIAAPQGVTTAPAATTPGTASVPAAAPSAQPTDEPAPRDRDYPWMSLATWWQRHEAMVAIDAALKQPARLVFLGDSITEGWDDAVWAELFGAFHPLRLGLGGDKTQNVIWRVTHGELDGMHPEVLVLLIGTNNLGSDQATPATVAKGVAKLVETVRQKLPGTRILVLGILPRDELPTAEVRQEIAATNALLARLDDGRQVRSLDIGQRLLEPDGRISREIMGDFLHPTPRGYRIIAEAIKPLLTEMLARND
jgi:beta-glucosidase